MVEQIASRDLPLVQAYPRLAEAIPWLPIGDWPTPVTQARSFAGAHGLAALYLKREDCSHAECGGNKVRGLEFLLAEAQRRGVGTLVTIGPVGSHHLFRTAWHARRLGIRTVALAIGQPPADYAWQNVLTGLAVGTTYVPANYVTLLPKLLWWLLRARWSGDGRPCMYVPPGGTSPLSCLGHVNAAFELKRSIDEGLLPEPGYLYAALGSVGTMAGLAAGCKLARLKTRLVGVVVSYPWACTPWRWARLARRTLRLMRRHDPTVPNVDILPSELTVIGTALGRGYAHFTESARSLARQFHECEQVPLDGTYTAKTLDGAMQYIRDRRLHDAVHLFWHSYHEMPEPDEAKTALLPRALKRFLAEETQPWTVTPQSHDPAPP
jgi:D-cysteine desulfhydrase